MEIATHSIKLCAGYLRSDIVYSKCPAYERVFHSENAFVSSICSWVQQNYSKYPTNMIGYMVLYCNRCRILFSQAIHKKQTQNLKKTVLVLTMQYLGKHSSTSYITTAFMLASGHPGLKIKTLYYYTLYGTVKYPKAQVLVEDARTWRRIPDTWTYMTRHSNAC